MGNFFICIPYMLYRLYKISIIILKLFLLMLDISIEQAMSFLIILIIENLLFIFLSFYFSSLFIITLKYRNNDIIISA